MATFITRNFRLRPAPTTGIGTPGYRMAVVSFCAAFAWAGRASATPIDQSWVFRSQVASGQSMWGPGTVGSYSASGKYTAGWPIAGSGVEWALTADAGTVRGNVEALVTAKYDNRVKTGDKTKIQFAYSPIDSESNINVTLGAAITATCRLKAGMPWPFPGIDWKMPMSVNASMRPTTDFTAELERTNTATARWEGLPFGADFYVGSGRMNIYLNHDIFFQPRTIAGTVTARHVDTGAIRTSNIWFVDSNYSPSAELDLDLPGHWDVQLQSFRVTDNTFRQELGFGADVGVRIPLLGADWSLGTDGYFDFFDCDFPLAFNAHGYDGNAATPDILGRFSIYAEPTPEPATAALLAIGGLFTAGSRYRRARGEPSQQSGR